ncbi:MAG: hypothetical protein GF350_04925 [Chitinivibrionales bacterium]|nr:hypothetical protein [Chitinivibrionales bacterium]
MLKCKQQNDDGEDVHIPGSHTESNGGEPLAARLMFSGIIIFILCLFFAVTYPHGYYALMHTMVGAIVLVSAVGELFEAGNGAAAIKLSRNKSFLKLISGKTAGFTAVFAVSVIMNVSLLFETWSTGIGHPLFTIGGLLPYCDAAAYHAGAQHLVEFGVLDAWNSARRPLPVAFYAFFLKLTGQNLQVTVFLTTLLIAISVFLAAAAVYRTSGITAGLLMIFLLSYCIAPYNGTFMTEPVGFVFGNCAFALIWSGIFLPNRFHALSGLALFVIAQHVRTGAILVAPLLCISIFFTFDGQEKNRITRALLPVLIIIVSLAAPLFPAKIISNTQESAQFSNIAHTLYGMVSGGKNWRHVYDEYPEISVRSQTEQSRLIYRYATKKFLENPSLFFITIVSRLREALFRPIHFLFPKYLPVPRYALALLLLGTLLVFYFCRKDISKPVALFFIFTFAGILFSYPVIAEAWPRVNATAMWFGCLLVSYGAGMGIRKAARVKMRPERAGCALTKQMLPHYLFAAILLAVIFAGPVFLRVFSPNPRLEICSSKCEDRVIVFRVSKGSSLYISEKNVGKAVPDITMRAYKLNNPSSYGNLSFNYVKEGHYLWEACDLCSRAFVHVVFDEDISRHAGKLVAVCAKRIARHYQYYVLYHAKDMKIIR